MSTTTIRPPGQNLPRRRCEFIIGPTLDDTQAGQRCSSQSGPGSTRCARHAFKPDGRSAQDVAAAFRKFLEGYSRMLGLDPEEVYAIHRGSERESILSVTLLREAADLLDPIR